jgi:hypothetical protein
MRAFLPVERSVHGISSLAQRGNELTVQIPIVFDNQKAHAAVLC